jgi:hypothetical protein
VFDITRHGEAFIGVKLCLGGGCFDKMVDIYLDLEDLRKSNSFLSKITPCCGSGSCDLVVSSRLDVRLRQGARTASNGISTTLKVGLVHEASGSSMLCATKL